MSFRPTDLRSIPLFSDIADAQLDKLAAAFKPRSLGAGEKLFSEGDIADKFPILVDGLIEARHGADKLLVRPVAPVGELGAMAGLERAMTAVAMEPSLVIEIATPELVRFFEGNSETGLRFHRSLMQILAEKIVRDRRRIEQVRGNLIQSQKAMKRLREALLEADDTPLHRMMFEELDAAIEHNRRGHYLVDVPTALATRLRLDDGNLREVKRMSNERLLIAPGPGSLPQKNGMLAAVLMLPDGEEIAVSGTVSDYDSDHHAEIALDLLIDEYADKLDRHLVKLQLLDVVL